MDEKDILKELLILITKKVSYKIVLNKLLMIFPYKKIIDKLIAILENKKIDKYKRENVAKFLAQIENNNKVTVALFKFVLDDSTDKYARVNTIKALHINNEYIFMNKLIKIAQNEHDNFIKERAVKLLGVLGKNSDKAFDTAIQLIKDKNVYGSIKNSLAQSLGSPLNESKNFHTIIELIKDKHIYDSTKNNLAQSLSENSLNNIEDINAIIELIKAKNLKLSIKLKLASAYKNYKDDDYIVIDLIKEAVLDNSINIEIRKVLFISLLSMTRTNRNITMLNILVDDIPYIINIFTAIEIITYLEDSIKINDNILSGLISVVREHKNHTYRAKINNVMNFLKKLAQSNDKVLDELIEMFYYVQKMKENNQLRYIWNFKDDLANFLIIIITKNNKVSQMIRFIDDDNARLFDILKVLPSLLKSKGSDNEVMDIAMLFFRSTMNDKTNSIFGSNLSLIKETISLFVNVGKDNSYFFTIIKNFIQCEINQNECSLGYSILEELIQLQKDNLITKQRNNDFWNIVFIFLENKNINYNLKLGVIYLLEDIEIDNTLIDKLLTIIKDMDDQNQVQEEIVNLLINKKLLSDASKISLLRSLI